MKRSVNKIIAFLILTIIVASLFVSIFSFKFKDGIFSLKNFYKCEDDSIDVIFYGTSHTYEGISTQVLWDNYGIASYDLCGSIQPLWNTYYYIKESLKTQKPQLMVVDCYSLVQNGDEIGPEKYIKNIYGMKPSIDKLNAVMSCFEKEKLLDYILEYPTYHSRYNELSREDFLPDLGMAHMDTWKGHVVDPVTNPQNRPEYDVNSKETIELFPKCEEYYRKIIELSKEEGIPLLLVVIPYSLDDYAMKTFNRAEEIALEYNIPFINFNYYYDDIGIDFDEDLSDYAHLNYKGSKKFSSYLGEMLTKEYSITDRHCDRSFGSYDSYDTMSQYVLLEICEALIKESTNYDEYKNLINKEEYLYVIVDRACDTEKITVVDRLNETEYSLSNDIQINKRIGKVDDLSIHNDGIRGLRIKINTEEYTTEDNSISVLVYDLFRERIVDFRIFDE